MSAGYWKTRNQASRREARSQNLNTSEPEQEENGSFLQPELQNIWNEAEPQSSSLDPEDSGEQPEPGEVYVKPETESS